MQGDAELVVGFDQLRVDFIEALGSVLHRFGRGEIGDFVEFDRRVLHMRPFRLSHLQPVAVGLQAPFEQPLGLVLAAGNEPDGVFIQARWQGVGLDIRGEARSVLLAYGVFDVFLRHNQ